MAIVKQGSTTINSGAKGDKGEQGDAGVVQSISAGANVTVDSSNPANPIVSSSGGGGGVGTIVTNLAGLESVTGIASIQSSIDLGTATATMQSGVTLRFDGGSIINGTLNGDDTYISSEEIVQIFGLDVTFTGTFNFRAALPEWFGGGVSAVENIEAFRKTMEFVRDLGGGNVEIRGNGIYDFSAYNPTSVDGTWKKPTGDGSDSIDGIINVYSNTHIVLQPQSTLRVIGTVPAPFDNTNQYHHIAFNRAHNSSLTGGGSMIGNRANEGNLDYHTGITFYGDCDGVVVENINQEQYPSDAFRARTAANYQGWTVPIWESGNISHVDGVTLEVDANKTRSTNFLDLTQSMTQALGWTRLVDTNNVYSQIQTPRGEFAVHFYKSNGDFIYAIEGVRMYEKILLAPEATQAKLVVYGGISTYPVGFTPREYPADITIRGNKFHDMGRQGISISGGQDWLIEDNECWNIFGAPGAFIDIEDGRWVNRRINIINNIWWNCYLGIRIYTVKDCLIENNKQLRGDGIGISAVGAPRNDSNWDELSPAINPSDISENVIVRGNLFEQATITSDLGFSFINNTYVYCRVDISQGISKGNTYIDSQLDINSYTELGAGYLLGYNYFVDISDEKFFNHITVSKDLFDHSLYVNPTLANADKVSLKNITIEGVNKLRAINITNRDIKIDGLKLLNGAVGAILFTNNVTGLETDGNIEIRLEGGAASNNYFKDWKIGGKLSLRTSSGVFDATNHFEFDNLQIDVNNVVSSSVPLLTFTTGTTLGSLTVKNSKITDRTSTLTNWNLISLVAAEKVRISNSTFETATAGNLIDVGTSTVDVNSFIYKDCEINGVVFNTGVGTAINNIVDGVLIEPYQSQIDANNTNISTNATNIATNVTDIATSSTILVDYVDNAAAIVGGLTIGSIYRLTGTGELRVVYTP